MIRSAFFCLVLTISSQVFSQSISANATSNIDGIHYVSLNHVIRAGQYDGLTTVKELKEYGDFGLGSTEKVEAELVVLDGIVYTIPNSGKAIVAGEGAKIAFSAIKFFKPDKSFKVSNVKSLNELEDLLDSALIKNSFAAIKISGIFTSIKYTCYKAQERPYKPIEDVPVTAFEKGNVEGTLVGFFTPESAKVINNPIYHFHFLDKAKSTGGHMQEIAIESAKVEIDYSTNLSIQLPDPVMMQHLDLNKPLK
jgi:acetolactate decarboxylase